MKTRSGTIVRTQGGNIGKTYNDEKPVGGKIRVYVERDGKTVAMLCNPKTLHISGFFD